MPLQETLLLLIIPQQFPAWQFLLESMLTFISSKTFFCWLMFSAVTCITSPCGRFTGKEIWVKRFLDNKANYIQLKR